MPTWHTGPHHHAIPNTVHKTVTATNDHNGEDDGAVVGTVAVGDSGMVAAAMAVMARHYIFYLCNKWILFLYFV